MDLKEFIEKYQEEINNKDFEEVYKNSYHDFESYAKIGKLTELFYKCGVNPLDFMGYVPAGYAYDLNIDKVTIPDNMTSIEAFAFAHCTMLTSVTIGSNVKDICSNAFAYCHSLKAINYTGSIEQWRSIHKSSSFSWMKKSPIETIHCTDGSIEFYR